MYDLTHCKLQPVTSHDLHLILTLRMSSHFSVSEGASCGKPGVRLRELDDSRRGARFSNRKEDVLLERKLSYLNNQVLLTI